MMSGVLIWVVVAVASAQPPVSVVATDEARFETIEQWRDVTGELIPVQVSSLACQESGLVTAVEVEAGDVVAAGDPIARLDDAYARLRVAEATSDRDYRAAVVTEREALQEKAVRDLQRAESFLERDAASETERADAATAAEQAKARLDQARAELAAAQAALDLAEKRLENLIITAPFAGRIVTKEAEVGQWIAPGETIVTLISLDPIDARLDVPERFVAQLRSEHPRISIRVRALDTIIEAGAVTIIPRADSLSRLFPVRVRLGNADGVLAPGMSITGLVPTGSFAPTLTVHKDAINRSEVGSFVYYIAGGAAAAAPVETLFASGERVAVRSDVLKPGMPVIVEGNERLFPGAPVQVVSATDTGAPRSNGHVDAGGGTDGP